MKKTKLRIKALVAEIITFIVLGVALYFSLKYKIGQVATMAIIGIAILIIMTPSLVIDYTKDSEDKKE